jgi:hypothetical protein
MEDLMEINREKEDAKRKKLAGQFIESWKYRALLLANSSPL